MTSYIANIFSEKTARESQIYSYTKSFNGFVARLLPHEAKKLLDEDSVISVFESKQRKLHTTRSWDFLGLTESLNDRNKKVESDVIVGVLDTGIYIDAPSFSDKGYGPAPAKWKGKCTKGANFTGCNKKVIGAKYFYLDNTDPSIEDPSPVDTDGHGTHTSSTIAGIPVKDASLYGIANGTARGGVPSARIAMYKVCWNSGCTDMDLLAAFDEAIADGVDLISVSIGGPSRSFFEDPIAIGSFHAMKNGILTSCSAGNDGPYLTTVQNVAPWIMTVAASSIDRQFQTAVKLGNGMETAVSLIVCLFVCVRVPSRFACDYGTLSPEKVKGKVVYCLGSSGQDYNIKDLGGAGVIMTIDEPTDIAFTPLIPGTFVMAKDGYKIDKYINSSKNGLAVIYKTRTIKMTAPFVASFSSRGPQLMNRNILKPDIAAPGLDILAAYSKLATITGEQGDSRYAIFNILSGTSMACPHAAAAAAYVKSFHPDWSAAAIKSAIMTTGNILPQPHYARYTLGSGSGQINPRKAVHPGLVYDISMTEYIRFLCKEGYNSTTIGLLIGGKKNFSCSNFKPAEGTDGLNYPSMHTQLSNKNSSISAEFYRTVTQVGYGNSVYKAKVTLTTGLSVKVVPDTLKFTRLHEKKSFKVVVKGSLKKKGTQILSAILEWSDSRHSVKSPILV
ncbi:Peptidase_S8 domain-containing protein/Inhibitor_I9 domain-containing protein, partial [Cephalotus follicularis]